MNLTAVPNIRPISDLRTNLNDVCNVARETHEPIFMTKNGLPALVVMDSEAYEEQMMHNRYVLKLREAEIEQKYLDQVVTQKQLDTKMDSIFKMWDV